MQDQSEGLKAQHPHLIDAGVNVGAHLNDAKSLSVRLPSEGLKAQHPHLIDAGVNVGAHLNGARPMSVQLHRREAEGPTPAPY